ncbi:MAG: hypothetical protein PWP23_1841 [Candidatus Sumerlaeota bacterium]|nr:hypothetical protein [Candidatus Sumerlaeota bacterium]
MTSLSLQLTLDGEAREYAPGEFIAGRAVIEAPEAWTAKYAELALGWHTEGIGDEDKAFTAIETLAKKGETPPRRIDHPFRLEVPPMPRTYHGRLIKIHWTIGLYARAKGADEVVLELPLTIQPRVAPVEAPVLPDAPLPWT